MDEGEKRRQVNRALSSRTTGSYDKEAFFSEMAAVGTQCVLDSTHPQAHQKLRPGSRNSRRVKIPGAIIDGSKDSFNWEQPLSCI